MLKWARNNPVIILLIIVAVAFVFAEGARVINYPPRSIHQWRQSDCFAYIKTYYQRGTGFFEPAGYNLIGRDGRVVSEFPVLYYLSAQLCRMLGFHYWLMRGLTFLCYIIGLVYLFLCCRLWIKGPLLALFPVIIMATAPYYYYYALNYLPNVPAISFSFCGFYYLLLYERSGFMKHLVPSTVFFILSALLKPTDGSLILMAYAAFVGLSFFSKKAGSRMTIGFSVSLLVILACIYSWYRYVNWYNGINGNVVNLQGIYPIWQMTSDEIVMTFTQRVMGVWRDSFQHISLLVLSGVFFVVYIVKWRSLHHFLRLFTLFLIMGSLAYTLLWYKAFGNHDYYQLIFVIPAVFLSITIMEYCGNKAAQLQNRYLKLAGATMLAGLAVTSIVHNREVQSFRYSSPLFKYQNEYIYEAEPVLRHMGIAPGDIIISVPDATPNVTLAAFGNPGFASDLFGPEHFTVSYCKAHGAKYMIITDSNYVHSPVYAPYTSKPLGQYMGIYMYDIR